MVSNIVNLNASSYSNLFGSPSGALYVPVTPSAVVYAQFDHIHGIAAPAGENGVSVNRISILNTLIEQLVSMKAKEVPSSEMAESLSKDEQEVLIEEYQRQIQNAIAQSQEQGLYGFAGLLPETGSIFSIVA